MSFIRDPDRVSICWRKTNAKPTAINVYDKPKAQREELEGKEKRKETLPKQE